MGKIKLSIMGFLVVCASLVMFSAFGSGPESGIQSNVSATTVWYEQTFSEKFWGDGVWQLRRKFSANAGTEISTRRYENKTFILGFTNSANVQVEKTYIETIRRGHAVSSTVKSKSTHFEAEIGYTFNYETVNTESTKIIIFPYTSAEVWESDVRISYQYVSVKVQEQVASWFSWSYTGNDWYESERIREYSGNYIEIY